jgi:hypothetical protein
MQATYSGGARQYSAERKQPQRGDCRQGNGLFEAAALMLLPGTRKFWLDNPAPQE